MGAYSWLFVRDSDDMMAARVKRRFPDAYSIKKCDQYLCVYLSRPEFNVPNDFLEKLSARNEVYWVTVSSTTEYFHYYHWNKGTLVRALDMEEKGADRYLWGVVSGKPEPWEAEALRPILIGSSVPQLGSDVSIFDARAASDIVMEHYDLEPLWLP
jgi:hypothetical protein